MVRCKVPQFLVVVSVFLIAVLVATIVCTTLCHSSSLLLLVASWGSFWLLSNRTLRGKTTEQTQHSELWSLLLLLHAAASYRICIAYSTVAKPPSFHKSKNGVFPSKRKDEDAWLRYLQGEFFMMLFVIAGIWVWKKSDGYMEKVICSYILMRTSSSTKVFWREPAAVGNAEWFLQNEAAGGRYSSSFLMASFFMVTRRWCAAYHSSCATSVSQWIMLLVPTTMMQHCTLSYLTLNESLSII